MSQEAGASYARQRVQTKAPGDVAVSGSVDRNRLSAKITDRVPGPQEMGIAQKTVDTHRSNICRKLEIGGQHALTRFAARHRTEI